MVELIGRDFDPRLVVFLIDVEEPGRLLGVLDHIGERLLGLGCCGGHCSGGGGAGSSSRRHPGDMSGAGRGRGRGGVLRSRLHGGSRDCRGFGSLVGRQGCATGHDEGRRRGNREGKTGNACTLHQETPQKTARGSANAAGELPL